MIPGWRKLGESVTQERMVFLGVGLLIVCLGMGGLWLVERELTARAGESLRIGAFDVSGKLDLMFQERTGDLKLLAEAAQVRSADVAGISKYLRAVQQAYPVYSRLAVANQTGRIIASTDADWIGQDAQSATWYQSVRHDPRIHIMTLFVPGQAEGSLDRMQFAAAVFDEQGEMRGVIVTEIDQTTWHQLVQDTVAQFLSQSQHVWKVRYKVLDQDGAIVLSSDHREIPDGNVIQKSPSSAELVKIGRSGYVEEQDLMRSVPVVTGYARMQGGEATGLAPWSVLVRVDRHDVLAGIRGLLLPVVLPGIALTVVVMRWVVRGKQHAERKKAEAYRFLKDSEAQFRAVVDTVIDGIITINTEGVVLSCNPAAERIFGYQACEIIGQNVNRLMPEPYASEHDGYVAHYVKTGESKIIGVGREAIGRRKDGSVFPLDLAISEMELNGRRCFTGVVRDITVRKQLMAQLTEREAFFRLLSEHLPVGVFQIDGKGIPIYTNKRLEQITQLSQEDLSGLNQGDSPTCWLFWFHKEDRQGLLNAWEQAKPDFGEVRHECRLLSAGEEIRWVQVLLWPTADDVGARYFGILEDITDRKRKTAHALQLLREGRFEFTTLVEAKALAELLAQAFPDAARSQIGLVELLVNSVEHGNLAISFDEKTELLERGTLDDEILRRLALPEHAEKRVRVALTRTGEELRLVIVDDGHGFDWRVYLSEDHFGSDASHGRGIAMAKLISFDSLEYRGRGNHVEISTKLTDGGADIPKAA